MNGRIRWAAAGLILGLAVAFAIPSFADSPSPSGSSRTVTVTGTATVRSAPDEAVVTLGVQAQASSAQEALQQNAAKMTDVMKALLDLGFKQDEIATAGINLYPNFGQNGQDITSYSAQNDVNVTIHDLSKVGPTIDKAVAAGANLTNGITFQLSDQNQGVDDALRAAVENARTKGQTLADAGGGSLGEVLHMSETSFSPGPVFEARAVAADAATPVSPPTIETQVSVSVTFALS